MPSLFGRATAVAADHVRLRSLRSRLEELSGAPEMLADADRGARELTDELVRAIGVHFEAEEDEGYFGALVAGRPELGPPIERLRAEHRRISARGAELLALSESSRVPREVASRLRELLDSFDAHESAENELLQDFFGRDEGGAGD